MIKSETGEKVLTGLTSTKWKNQTADFSWNNTSQDTLCTTS